MLKVFESQANCMAFVVARAVAHLDISDGDTVIFEARTANGLLAVTVGAIWLDDIRSWRVQEGYHKELDIEQSVEFFAGDGDAVEAEKVIAALCWRMGELASQGVHWRLQR